MKSVSERAEELQPQLVSWRREFHESPELKMDIPVTAGKIERILKETGITEIRANVGGGGICAVIRGAKPGKCCREKPESAMDDSHLTGTRLIGSTGSMNN